MSLFNEVNNMNFFTILLLASLTILSYSTIYCSPTGKIKGKVIDENDLPLTGANIVLEGTYLGAAADVDGQYIILNVLPGTYTIKVSMIGYTTVRVENVTINTDRTTIIDVQLHMEPIEGEEIVVIAKQPIIAKDVTSTERKINSDEIKNMPVNSYQAVVSLAPGVTADYRGMHLRGGRVGEVAYEVDGLRTGNIRMPNAAISELSISSGGFNAEYGDALSGIINITTKEGGSQFEGKFEAQIEFPEGSNNYKTGYRRFVFNLSGPSYLLENLKFFISGEYITADDGYPGKVRTDQPLDASIIHAKLTFNFTPTIKLGINYIYNFTGTTSYNIQRQLIPYTNLTNRYITQIVQLQFNHLLDETAFYNLYAGYNFNHNRSNQPGKWYDITQTEDWNTINPSDSTDTWGSIFAVDNGSDVVNYLETRGDNITFIDNQTKQVLVRGSLTKTFGQHHTIKAGFDFRFEDLNYMYASATLGYPYTYAYGKHQPMILNDEIVRAQVPDWLNLQDTRPKNYAFYFQDKIEYEGLIMNVGLRFDAFDASVKTPFKNPETDLWHAFYPGNDTLIYPIEPGDNPDPYTYSGTNGDIPILRNLSDVDVKYQFSPRLGISHPITDRDVLHFSYGHFFQVPNYNFLYSNQNISADYWWVIGNPNLKPEKSINYEVGIAHAFSNDFALDFTGFYKDIYNLVQQRPFVRPADRNANDSSAVITNTGILTFVNSDWGNVKGFEASLRKKPSRYSYFSGSVSYTYMIAQGQSSDPREGLLRLYNGTVVPSKSYPLDWDSRHKVVLNLDYRVHDNFGFNLVMDYNSALPYTGTQSSLQWEYNDERLPDVFQVDLRANKIFKLSDSFSVNIYLFIINLLDARNVTRFNDEGTYVPIAAYLETYPGGYGGPLNNPLVYSSHREIRVGLELMY